MCMRVAAGLLYFVLVSFSASALAATTELRGIEQKQICAAEHGSTRYLVAPKKLVNWLTDTYKVSRRCLDVNDDGDTLFSEIVERFADGAHDVDKKICSSNDKDSLRDARDLLRSMTKDRGTYFSSSARSVYDAFEPATIVCAKMTPEKAVTPIGEPLFPDKVKVGNWRLKLRKDPDSLRYEVKESKAKAAEFSVADDGVKNKTTYNVAATLGLDSGSTTVPGTKFNYDLMPYVRWEQMFVSPAPKKGEINNLATGLIAFMRYAPETLPLVSWLSLDGEYLTDSEGDSDIGAMTVRWEPTLILSDNPPIELPWPEATVAGLFVYSWDFAAVARAGKVFDPGRVPNLLVTGNFLYWGPEFSLTAAGLQGGLLEPLSLNVAYYYLYGEKGQFDHISAFKADLSYKLTKDANVELKLSYEKGRDLEKFDDRDLWKTSLGYKF